MALLICLLLDASHWMVIPRYVLNTCLLFPSPGPRATTLCPLPLYQSFLLPAPSASPPTHSSVQDHAAAMSGDYEDDLCRRALILVSDLCARVRDADTNDRCQEFNELRIRGYPRGPDAGQNPCCPSWPLPLCTSTAAKTLGRSEQGCSAFHPFMNLACCCSVPKPLNWEK